MKLYKHQQAILDKNPQQSLLCWDTGTGKSLAAIHLALKNGGSTLIICPKSLKKKWRRDAGIHDLFADVMSKEEFKKLYKTLIKYENIINDEAHYFSGMKSALSKALYSYINHHKPRVWLLTATPYLSTPWNIYTLAKHLGHNWSYINFKQKFFELRWMGPRAVPVVKDGIEDDIAMLVAKIGDIVKLDDCAEVPDQVFLKEDFGLSKVQKDKIKEVDDVNAIVKFTKKHEIENGFLIGDGYEEDVTFGCEKNERLLEYVRTNKKVVIVCRYNLQIEMLRQYFAGTKGNKATYVINGATKNKDEMITEIEGAKECVVLINASCSEGYELPSIGMIIFASLSFSYKDYKQMLGRFLRINKLKKNVYIHFVVTGGVDEAVYDSMMKKEDFNISIYSQSKKVL